jgi:uncharacterized BrkB/YihY/UPF0761 family membrane protein
MDFIQDILSGLGIFLALFGVVMVIVSILIFAFWVLMIIDCVKRKFKDDMERVVWLLVIILTGILGALIYYFVVKRNGNQKKKRKR